jgi:hypothetical protein
MAARDDVDAADATVAEDNTAGAVTVDAADAAVDNGAGCLR